MTACRSVPTATSGGHAIAEIDRPPGDDCARTTCLVRGRSGNGRALRFARDDRTSPTTTSAAFRRLVRLRPTASFRFATSSTRAISSPSLPPRRCFLCWVTTCSASGCSRRHSSPAGTVLVWLLAYRVSQSRWIALVAAAVALVSLPRAYDYDKVLFYPLGRWCCWRYVEHRRPRVLWVLAGALTLGALFRYDTAVYVGCAALTVIAAAHADDWRLAAKRATLVAGALACFGLPSLAALQYRRRRGQCPRPDDCLRAA